MNLVRQLLEGSAEVESVCGRGDVQHVLQVLRSRSRSETTFQQRLGPVHDDLGGIELVPAPKAVALGASAIRAVEREGARFQLRHANTAIGAGEPGRIEHLLATDYRNLHQATSELHRKSD